MINLLPEESKKDILAGRTNVILLRYNALLLATIFVIAIFCLLFLLVLEQSRAIAIATNKNNSNQVLALRDVKKQADEYRGNLSIAKQILDNSISYTDIILSITNLLPDGVILDGINLKIEDLDKQTALSARALTYEDAIELKESFQSSRIFSNVYFNTIASSPDSTNEKYPILVNISVKFNKTEILK